MRFRLSFSGAIKACYCLSLVLGPLLGLGCESQGIDPTGGETHFLRLCDESADSCGGELKCLCGVCTRPCDDEQGCSSLPKASCRAELDEVCSQPKDDEPELSGVCEVFCEEKQDCLSVSADLQCISGVCREATDSSTTDEPDGMGGADGTCTPGDTSANEVLVMGDSFFATTHQITAYLEDSARNAGSLAPGYRYRDASRLVNNALALPGAGLLDQFQSSALDSEVKFVITNGGGADVLLGSCETLDSDCPMLQDATNGLAGLLAAIADQGVEGVVYVSYPDPEPEAVRARLDVLRPMLEQVCSGSPVPCHFLDLRPIFADNHDEYIADDGLNPTAAGSQATAEAIWTLMEQNCIAQ